MNYNACSYQCIFGEDLLVDYSAFREKVQIQQTDLAEVLCMLNPQFFMYHMHCNLVFSDISQMH